MKGSVHALNCKHKLHSLNAQKAFYRVFGSFLSQEKKMKREKNESTAGRCCACLLWAVLIVIFIQNLTLIDALVMTELSTFFLTKKRLKNINKS